MSAIVIYPAAFQDAAIAPKAYTHTAADSTPADVIPLTTKAPHAETPVGALRTIRVAASQSAACLAQAENSLDALRAREADMARRSQAINTASRDLGTQMERLIEETRRMVSYLRTERMM
jgi:cysteine sulfinate desulfinase/cysteine desulfurase-like protein